MKNLLFFLLLALGAVQSAEAVERPAAQPTTIQAQTRTVATLEIVNRSAYTLTVKILHTGGRGLYTTVSISHNSSTVVYFSSTDRFFTKTKAEKGWESLYRKGSEFSVHCDDYGYSQGRLQFYVSGRKRQCRTEHFAQRVRKQPLNQRLAMSPPANRRALCS